MKIRILRSAEQDLLSGYSFYEERGQGLGAYFLDSLFADIDSLHLYAGIHPIYFSGYCRLLAKRFPFAIYYTTDDDVAVIHAVLDCRQNPERISERLT